MTHLFKQCYSGHRSRSAEEELVLIVNPATQRILNYQRTTNLKKIHFPLVCSMLKFTNLDKLISHFCVAYIPRAQKGANSLRLGGHAHFYLFARSFASVHRQL